MATSHFGVAGRHDGFSEERRQLFLTALRLGESVLGACARVGISNRTAYNHRQRDPAFAHAWRLARKSYALPCELVAFQRAVEGRKEQVYSYGKPSHVRTHYSDALLRQLLIADQPEKYGRYAAPREERERLDRRIAARVAAETATLHAALGAALAEIAALKARFADAAAAPGVNFVNPESFGSAPAAPSNAAPPRFAGDAATGRESAFFRNNRALRAAPCTLSAPQQHSTAPCDRARGRRDE